MRSILLTLALASSAVTSSSWLARASSDTPSEQVQPCKPVFKIIAVKKGFIATNDPSVRAFADRLGVQGVVESADNPICCIRIEPLGVDKNITGEQFVMIHYGYTLIQVTSSKGLFMLNEELARRHICDSNSLPIGIISSFRPVAAAEEHAAKPQKPDLAREEKPAVVGAAMSMDSNFTAAINRLRSNEAENPKIRNGNGSLDMVLAGVRPWPDNDLPWPNENVLYDRTNWDGLVAAARIVQRGDPAVVERALADYQASHPVGHRDDSKLLLTLRVAFDLPENESREGWTGFGGWRDVTGSGNMKTNSAWPILWNSGRPRLVVGFTLFQGQRYNAALEYGYFRQKYRPRDLAEYKH